MVKYCKHCGVEFNVSTQNANKKYCSANCMNNYWKHLQRAKRKATIATRKCKLCGEEFKPRHERQNFCCHYCSVKYHNFRKKEPNETPEQIRQMKSEGLIR